MTRFRHRFVTGVRHPACLLYFTVQVGDSGGMHPNDTIPISELAATHGLDIDPTTIVVTEVGLDFRVAIADASDGRSWVMRILRRPDVTERAVVEGRLLSSIAPHLSVSVPDWQIQTDALVAYPLLPGSPGLTIDDDGQPQWHFDVESAVYARSLGDVLAELHGLDPTIVADTGIPMESPDEVRARKREEIGLVTAEFDVAPDLLDRWSAWLGDDRFWPSWTTVTHGEIYPAHQLMDGPVILGLLDWTTASVGDPARDFAFHQASVSPETFDATVRQYVDRGGRVWSMLAEHCAHLFSTAAVELGLYALETGDEGHFAAAKEQLEPHRG